MKFTTTKRWALPLVLLLVCSSYSDQRAVATTGLPELGGIVSTTSGWWRTTTTQIGIPKLEKPLKMALQPQPFTKTSYKQYTRYTEKTGQHNTIAYHDSLAVAPTYWTLQIVDKIALAQHLNSDANTALRDYIAHNAKARIVTAVDGVVSDTLLPILQNARLVLLTQDRYKNMQLLLKGEKQEHTVYLNAIHVFNVTTSSFCWGEDQYGTLRINQLVPERQNCPKGTFIKASKVHKHNTSLKI